MIKQTVTDRGGYYSVRLKLPTSLASADCLVTAATESGEGTAWIALKEADVDNR